MVTINTYQALSLPLAVIVNILSAVILGVVIGLDRQMHQKATCIKSNALIALGSCLFVIVGYVQQMISLTSPIDTTRIVSQVVSGVGFIGAGVIFRDKTWGVSGITTAATIWCVAGLGVLCAAGFPLLALAATIVILVVLNVIPRRGIPDKEQQQ